MTDGPGVCDIPTPGLYHASYLAQVVSVEDPEGIGRVQVKLLSFDGVEDHDAPVWARVATPFAGRQRGAFLIPDVGDEVIVTFVNGDARMPVVIGGVWNGSAPPPAQFGGNGDRVDRWMIVGKAGSKIAIVEERDGEARIELETAGGVTAKLNDAGGGSVELQAAGSTITIDSNGVTVQSGGTVSIDASEVTVKSARPMRVNAPLAEFSGVVKCLCLDTPAVVGKTYTPGAGNVW